MLNEFWLWFDSWNGSTIFVLWVYMRWHSQHCWWYKQNIDQHKMLTLLCILKSYSAKIYYIVYVLLCVCRYMHACEQREQRLVLGVFLSHSPLSFLSQGARVCHWAWRSRVWQDCLVCKSLGPTFLHLLSFEGIAMYYHAWLFRGWLG